MADQDTSRVPLLASSSSRLQSSSDISFGTTATIPGYGSFSTYPTAAASPTPVCFESEDEFDPGKTSITQQAHDEIADDLQITITGLQDSPAALLLYKIAGVLSFGIIFLLGRWLPSVHRKATTQITPLESAKKVLIRNQFGEEEQIPVQILQYDGRLSQLFPTQSHFKIHSPSYDPLLATIQTFRYRLILFVLNPTTGMFQSLSYWKDTRWLEDSSLLHNGLQSSVVRERMALFDKNECSIPQKSTGSLLVEEVLHPFYVFQVFSIVLWCFEQYHIYAASIFLISSFSVISTLIQTRANWCQIQEMSRFVCDVQVLRDGQWFLIPSSELVPGDLFDLATPGLQTFPCDSVLLQGDCIVNEGMLTGESIPVSKLPLADGHELVKELDQGMINLPAELARSVLFSGTQIIRVRRGAHAQNAERRAVGMVLRTGFNTTKGSLVRSILFPRPNLFRFYRDSFYFIGVMALIAMIGFVATVFKLVSLGMSVYLIVVRALDLVTIVVPPALPATMSVGMSFAVSRLREHGVFCIAPSRINLGGKVDAMCFDKTGTLTEEGLDVLGVQACEGQFHSLQSDLQSTTPQLLHCLATCHSIKVVDGELLGDPLDLRMFEATGWTLEEGGNTHEANASDTYQSPQLIPSMVRPPNQQRFSLANMDDLPEDYTELAILRSFEFSSSLRRMSVVVKRWRASTTEVYVKGAPEVIAGLCTSASLPADYHAQLMTYTQAGYRVIACAGKSRNKLSWVKVQRASRKEIESELTFLGFMIFENRLKPGTGPAIRTLHSANIRMIMCTGDNHLTAISVAKECGIIHHDAHVFVSRLVNFELVWEAQGGYRQLDPNTIAFKGNYSLAVTGDAFRFLVDRRPSQVQRVLAKAQVFARMSPDEKRELVELLQGMDYCIGFCGDGANDCGALKAADIGISLSDTEASVAAPFTSNGLDISCVPLVIREGRAALVTSFSCFKYMGLYSIVQFTTITLLYMYGSNLGDYQFLLIDLALILPVAVAMGRTHPHEGIHPRPPTASLISRRVLVSFIGQCALNALFQIATYSYMVAQPWFIPPTFDPKDPNIASMINTALFHLSSYQYLWGAIVFSVGYPYRKPMYTNVPFMGTLASLLVFLLWIQLDPHPKVTKVLELVSIPDPFRTQLAVVAFVNLITSYLFECWGVPIISRVLAGIQMVFSTSKRRVSHGLSLQGRASKTYQVVLRQIESDSRGLSTA
ncbi:hypothetical protein DSO57_1021714 [Entomophthora muscae]|nr:hypothetical protein DSO57_1021714 [Entomophthora muscae]